ncbi:MAG: hypothetical protein IJ308_00155 [Clostridia bacterium]|nr:hypothetical protein [Clostridia bacterium]
MEERKYYEKFSIDVIVFERMDVLTVSGGENMQPSGDYDDGSGWNE